MANPLPDEKAVVEGAVHSIRNMGDVAFVILRRREGIFQTVLEKETAEISVHDLKEGMTLRIRGILREEQRRSPWTGTEDRQCADSFFTVRTNAPGH